MIGERKSGIAAVAMDCLGIDRPAAEDGGAVFGVVGGEKRKWGIGWGDEDMAGEILGIECEVVVGEMGEEFSMDFRHFKNGGVKHGGETGLDEGTNGFLSFAE